MLLQKLNYQKIIKKSLPNLEGFFIENINLKFHLQFQLQEHFS